MTTFDIHTTFGSVRRAGAWTVPGQLDVRLLWADAELDFRDARLPPGVTTIEVKVTMANLEIVVPPGLPVDVQLVPFAGNVEMRHTRLLAAGVAPRRTVPSHAPAAARSELDEIRAALDEDAGIAGLDADAAELAEAEATDHPYRTFHADELAPSLRIIGRVRFANVEIITRLPGESRREARRRERHERRAFRRLHGCGGAARRPA